MPVNTNCSSIFFFILFSASLDVRCGSWDHTKKPNIKLMHEVLCNLLFPSWPLERYRFQRRSSKSTGSFRIRKRYKSRCFKLGGKLRSNFILVQSMV